MKNLRQFVVLSALLVPQAGAAQDHRELGPHVHGHGILNIAVEERHVTFELDVPGMDIVGFEHAAVGPEQQETIKRSEAQLVRPLELFKLPASAGCKVIDTKVEVEAAGEHDHDKEAAAKAETAGGGDHHEGHRDYNASYALECERPADITTITFDYFGYFKGAHGLTVNVVSDKAQNSYEVTSDKPVLKLGGTM